MVFRFDWIVCNLPKFVMIVFSAIDNLLLVCNNSQIHALLFLSFLVVVRLWRQTTLSGTPAINTTVMFIIIFGTLSSTCCVLRSGCSPFFKTFPGSSM